MAIKFELVSEYAPAGDQPKAIEQLIDGLRRRQDRSRCCSARPAPARRSRWRNVIADAQQADAGPRPQQDARRPALQGVQGASSRTTPSATSSATTTTTSPKRTSRSGTSTSRRTPVDQREHRPPAARRHAAPRQPRGRDHRRAACRASTASARPSDYKRMMVYLPKGEVDRPRRDAAASSIDIQYERNDIDFERGKFRVRGDVVEVWPAYEEFAYRIELFGDEVDALDVINPLTGEVHQAATTRSVHLPGQALRHARGPGRRRRSRASRQELDDAARAVQEARASCSKRERLKARTPVRPGDAPRGRLLLGHRELQPVLLAAASRASRRTRCIDFFPEDFLLVVDESHVTLPQVRGMYNGDRSRKTTLVEHGFRLPSAMDNRPLQVRRVREAAERSACACRPRPARTNWRRPAARSSSRSSGRRGWSTRSSTSSPARGPGAGPAGRRSRSGPRRSERDARHGADQAAGRGPDATTSRRPGCGASGCTRELDAIERVDDPARTARRGVRRAGRRQPAPRGARPARGVAGGDPRRRQGGVPAVGQVADPDDRPGGPERERRGDPVRRHDDRQRCSGRSTRRTAGGRSSWRTTPSTASRRRRCRRRSSNAHRGRDRGAPDWPRRRAGDDRARTT